MKKTVLFGLLLMLFSAGAWEHEFLTPDVLVVKSSRPVIVKHSRPRLKAQGFWSKENALLRNRQKRILRKPDITYFVYLFFEKKLSDDTQITLTLADGSTRRIRYKAAIPTNVIKYNQSGYLPSARKYAYIGMWCGSAGALDIKYAVGKNFELRRQSDNKLLFNNAITLRRQDPLYQGKIPFTGEIVGELDFSTFKTPGRYYLYVPGIGKSRPFMIGEQIINEAFYIHARGLYHQRCGTAKKKPYTHWESEACHQTAVRGRFPENIAHYTPKENRISGFFDRKGKPLKIRHFDLIKHNMPYKQDVVKCPGGWHDAADYDRRPFHLQIVCDLATVYLLKPRNFIDSQLNIPESGNGIPDILDEAIWGLKHLLAVQQKNGGTGTWIETVNHPGPGEGFPAQDKRTYYISAPSRNGTLCYAAAAATLALTLPPRQAEVWKNSAQRAWDFAMDKRNRLAVVFQHKGKMITYCEETQLEPDSLLRAALALFKLTGDKKYMAFAAENKDVLLEFYKRNNWKLSPLSWMLLALFPAEETKELLTEYKKVTCRNADKMLDEQENSYPYRTLWHKSDGGWVHAMSWGNYHPLRRAMTLIAAHALTQEKKYLDGALLANDYHNGANPLGLCMTSRLGHIYPAVFLDLTSYARGFKEFTPGITPYGNTFGIDANAVKIVYGSKKDQLPIWRRRVNLEFLSVPSSEYSVWETIAPAAAVTGYLIQTPALPSPEIRNQKPADDFRKLSGYKHLP